MLPGNLSLGAHAAAALIALIISGCGRSATSSAADAQPKTSDDPGISSGMQASPLESTNVLRSFATRGVIRDLPAEGKTVVIKHEDIPGFMPKMTMEFDVRDPKELEGLKPGDTVTFHVKADQNESWIEGIQRSTGAEPAEIVPADPSSASLLHAALLKPGDRLPDVELLAEDGRTIRFSDFEGKAVAFTFIFTRCPLPDYCPRMNQNFSKARELLVQSADAPLNWQFLSISFDPEFDKPGVLSRYAFSYRGGLTNQWLFASAAKQVLSTLSPLLDFRFADEQGSLQHNLRTVVVDPQRRIYHQFEGNKWTAEALAEKMEEAAKLAKPAHDG